MSIIRQSTARTILVGPVLDSAGAAKTDEVVASIKVTKNGSVGAANGSATLTHNHAGKYLLALTTSDTDTVGVLEVSLNSGTNDMPVARLNVVEEAIFDALFAASAAGFSTLDAAGIRTAVGMAAANLDTQIGTLATASNLAIVAGYLDTEVAAILAAVDAEVAAILEDTGTTLPATLEEIKGSGFATGTDSLKQISDNLGSNTDIIITDQVVTVQ